ncbi:hypothetical protein WA158_001876 [Blastocystis sp. Blastoise]
MNSFTSRYQKKRNPKSSLQSSWSQALNCLSSLSSQNNVSNDKKLQECMNLFCKQDYPVYSVSKDIMAKTVLHVLECIQGTSCQPISQFCEWLGILCLKQKPSFSVSNIKEIVMYILKQSKDSEPMILIDLFKCLSSLLEQYSNYMASFYPDIIQLIYPYIQPHSTNIQIKLSSLYLLTYICHSSLSLTFEEKSHLWNQLYVLLSVHYPAGYKDPQFTKILTYIFHCLSSLLSVTPSLLNSSSSSCLYSIIVSLLSASVSSSSIINNYSSTNTSSIINTSSPTNTSSSINTSSIINTSSPTTTTSSLPNMDALLNIYNNSTIFNSTLITDNNDSTINIDTYKDIDELTDISVLPNYLIDRNIISQNEDQLLYSKLTGNILSFLNNLIRLSNDLLTFPWESVPSILATLIYMEHSSTNICLCLQLYITLCKKLQLEKWMKISSDSNTRVCSYMSRSHDMYKIVIQYFCKISLYTYKYQRQSSTITLLLINQLGNIESLPEKGIQLRDNIFSSLSSLFSLSIPSYSFESFIVPSNKHDSTLMKYLLSLLSPSPSPSSSSSPSPLSISDSSIELISCIAKYHTQSFLYYWSDIVTFLSRAFSYYDPHLRINALSIIKSVTLSTSVPLQSMEESVLTQCIQFYVNCLHNATPSVSLYIYTSISSINEKQLEACHHPSLRDLCESLYNCMLVSFNQKDSYFTLLKAIETLATTIVYFELSDQFIQLFISQLLLTQDHDLYSKLFSPLCNLFKYINSHSQQNSQQLSILISPLKSIITSYYRGNDEYLCSLFRLLRYICFYLSPSDFIPLLSNLQQTESISSALSISIIYFLTSFFQYISKLYIKTTISVKEQLYEIRTISISLLLSLYKPHNIKIKTAIYLCLCSLSPLSLFGDIPFLNCVSLLLEDILLTINTFQKSYGDTWEYKTDGMSKKVVENYYLSTIQILCHFMSIGNESLLLPIFTNKLVHLNKYLNVYIYGEDTYKNKEEYIQLINILKTRYPSLY